MKPFTVAKDLKDGAAHTLSGKRAQSWIEPLARFGYAIRGVLYATVGFLALQVALGQGGATTDKGGAIATIGAQPFGKVLLVLVAVGLAGYSLWGVVRALLDPLNRGTDAKGLAQRTGYLVSALSYGALVLPTIQLLTGTGDGPNGGGNQDWTAKLLSAPAGPLLVGLIGVIAMAGGLGQIYQAWSEDFKKDFKAWEMSAGELRWATRVAQFGLVARGIVLAMLGFFLIQAALHVDPNQAKGLDGALQALAHQPLGPWLLGLVALGLIAFGIYSLLCARWVRIR
ncbi:MAG TPA: DUF1206 domain-containing protein [Chloroflexia bacterium]|nr:DUF1206 domain-containing protein [Chloroflexia bacterium]